MGDDRQNGITLLTGVPRSGTTLCCNLLNQCDNVVALHEPIDPQKLTSTNAPTAVDEIAQQINAISSSLRANQAIEHGDSAGIGLDNPVGLDVNKQGLRLQKATRGLVTLPAIDSSTKLFVKQNALFTALSTELSEQFEIVAIVRNPVDVLLSWMTVNLPVNKGRLPAGEKYDLELANHLKEGSVFERQVKIYRWFIEKFRQAGLTPVRYEDIIHTNGAVLFSTVRLEKNVPLQIPERQFPVEVIEQILKHWAAIAKLGLEAGYSKTLLDERFDDINKASKEMKLGIGKLLNRKQDKKMEFEGLAIIDNGVGNTINIEKGTKFTASRIEINGDNNTINISKNREINRLSINLRGNCKVFSLAEGVRNINNLKFTSIRGESQTLTIGKNFSCGGLEIQMNDGDERCVIGDECLFSWGIKLRTSDGHSIVDLETNKAINLPEDIVIGDRVWCSEDVKFLKGCKVANDTVVGSGSIVTKKFDKPNTIVAGIPARVVKEGIRWDRRMPYEFNSQ